MHFNFNPFQSNAFSHIMPKVLEIPLCVLRGQRSNFPKYDVSISLKIVRILANIEDPDEMPLYLDIHC